MKLVPYNYQSRLIDTTDTTDVQRVVAVQTDSDIITVQCDFITGSDAEGCMVVLVCDDGYNTTAMLSSTECKTLGVS